MRCIIEVARFLLDSVALKIGDFLVFDHTCHCLLDGVRYTGSHWNNLNSCFDDGMGKLINGQTMSAGAPHMYLTVPILQPLHV